MGESMIGRVKGLLYAALSEVLTQEEASTFEIREHPWKAGYEVFAGEKYLEVNYHAAFGNYDPQRVRDAWTENAKPIAFTRMQFLGELRLALDNVLKDSGNERAFDRAVKELRDDGFLDAFPELRKNPIVELSLEQCLRWTELHKIALARVLRNSLPADKIETPEKIRLLEERVAQLETDLLEKQKNHEELKLLIRDALKTAEQGVREAIMGATRR